jgi:hypothetical protein
VLQRVQHVRRQRQIIFENPIRFRPKSSVRRLRPQQKFAGTQQRRINIGSRPRGRRSIAGATRRHHQQRNQNASFDQHEGLSFTVS